MKLISYADALKAGKEKLGKMLIPAKIMKARKRAELEMCTLDEKLAQGEDDLQNLCTADELDFKKIIDKLDAIALLERQKEQYADILAEMFPE